MSAAKTGRPNPPPSVIGKNRERDSRNCREQRVRLNNAVHAALGGRCVVCGFSDSRALQIDHVDGGGSRENKNKSRLSFLRMVLESALAVDGKYQLLCANCNWIKRCENNET